MISRKQSIRQWLSWNVRRISAPIRVLPDFIIIGAQRCGTTSLYRYLCTHPAIGRAAKKEVHFFDNSFKKSINSYRIYFQTFFYKYYRQQISHQALLTGEASPYYLFHPLAPHRISQSLPRVKLIVLLRNPVDRAYSHYWHEVRRGKETLSFEEAIEREPERLWGQRERLIFHDGAYYSATHQHFSYLARGIYVDQLSVWQRLFPKEQFLILRSEEFYADPATTLNRIFAFLNLPSWSRTDDTIYNHSDYPSMTMTTKKQLADYFRPHNERLYEFLGQDFGWESQ